MDTLKIRVYEFVASTEKVVKIERVRAVSIWSACIAYRQRNEGYEWFKEITAMSVCEIQDPEAPRHEMNMGEGILSP